MDEVFAAASNRLTIDLAALAENWRQMGRLSGSARAAAVLKADAYGLGLEPAAQTLYAAGARDFFVASAEEGVALRPLVPEGRIFVLAGLWPAMSSCSSTTAWCRSSIRKSNSPSSWRPCPTMATIHARCMSTPA